MAFHPLTAVAIFATIYSTTATAQAPEAPAPIVRDAMAKLHWLKGDWQGTGWRNTPTGREHFEVNEKVIAQLDDLVLVIHGHGWTMQADGSKIISHKAFAVFSYDAYRKTYHFDSFVKEGYQTRSVPKVGENEFQWSHPAGPGAEMRYHARLTENGEWLETGERCVAEKCTPYLEMRLSKQAP